MNDTRFQRRWSGCQVVAGRQLERHALQVALGAGNMGSKITNSCSSASAHHHKHRCICQWMSHGISLNACHHIFAQRQLRYISRECASPLSRWRLPLPDAGAGHRTGPHPVELHKCTHLSVDMVARLLVESCTMKSSSWSSSAWLMAGMASTRASHSA